jgi:sugar O-acyltransferase (sialic acid O-acetyltransferase NeuD family)
MRTLIVGAGAQGRVIADILRARGGHDAIAFIDENESLWGAEVNGIPVLGGLAEVLRGNVQDLAMIVALGNPMVRLRVAKRIEEGGVALLNAIHPSAVVMPSAKIGRGDMVAANAVLNSNARIGNHVIVNTGAVVEHDCVVADLAAIGPGAHLGGRVTLGRAAFVSTGAIVVSRRSIGAESVVGAGAVVTRDLPERVLALGVPARIVEHLDETFDWNRVL